MSCKTLAVLAISMLLSIHVIAEKVPENAWETGVLDGIAADQTAGPDIIAGTTIVHTNFTLTHYVLHGSKYIYQADRRTTRRDKRLDLTIRGPVTFAVVGMTVFVKDEEGKVHKLDLITKRLPS